MFSVHVVISIIFLFVILILFVDLLYRIRFMLRRYHIGRWNNDLNWEQAVEKTCFRWLQSTPNVRPSDKNHYLLFDILQGNIKNSTIQSWQMAGIIWGISSLNSKKSHHYLNIWKKRYLSEEGKWKNEIKKVDLALLAYSVLRNYDKDEIRPAMDYVISIIEHNLCSDGMVSYSQGTNSEIRFVDTLGMICPFLALYGQVYNESKYIELAYSQILKYRKIGMLKDTELPCHAINIKNKLPLGVYGWGRGTGWYMLALIETYKSIDNGDKKQNLRNIIQTAANQYYNFQKEDGGFLTILQGAGQYDSTATILMLYFYVNCYKIFEDEKYLLVADKAIAKIKTVTMMDGAVDQCQGDTHGIGIFSQDFDIMPFAQGILLLAIRTKEGQTV